MKGINLWAALPGLASTKNSWNPLQVLLDKFPANQRQQALKHFQKPPSLRPEMLYRWTKAERAEGWTQYRIKLPKQGFRWNSAPKSKAASCKPSTPRARNIPGNLPVWSGRCLEWWMQELHLPLVSQQFVLKLSECCCAGAGPGHAWALPSGHTPLGVWGKGHCTLLRAGKSREPSRPQ